MLKPTGKYRVQHIWDGYYGIIMPEGGLWAAPCGTKQWRQEAAEFHCAQLQGAPA
jgi:hypothetical protein